MSDDQKIDVFVQGVEAKTFNRKSDGQPMTMYEVGTTEGTYATNRREVAEAAYKTIGTKARLTVKVEVSSAINQHTGQPFVNRYLQAVEAIPVLPDMPEMANAMAAQPPFPSAPSDRPVQNAPGPTDFPTPEGIVTPQQKQTHIHRQTATKVAAHLAQTADEFWRNVEELIHFYDTGQKPGQAPQTQAVQPDDDIPF